MKKRDLFDILLRVQLLCYVALLFVGCSHDDDFFPTEEVVYQADITSVADSVEVSANDTTSVQGRQRNYPEWNDFGETSSTQDATANFSVSVFIDNDETAELGEGTKITIKDIAIKVCGDSIANYYYPAPNEDLAEPTAFTGWHNLPTGVSKQKTALFCNEDCDIVKIPAGINPTVCIRFVYIVRTWDPHLADGYSEVQNYYYVEVPFGFSVSGGSFYHLPLRIALTSVKFDAGVSSYE